MARWIFPITQPPIKGGFLRVVDGQIVELGNVSRCDRGTAELIDLGDVALLPKFVNAHTHLEFSDCKNVIGQPGIPLADWIGQVIAARGIAGNDQREQAVALGLAESVAAGVGLIGDIATPPCAYPECPSARIVSFAEVLGLSPERSNACLERAQEHGMSLANVGGRVDFALSPHAPYSTPLEIVRQTVELANRTAAPVAMHVAEAVDERELLERGSGRFAQSLRDAGFWRQGLFPWTTSEPVSRLITELARADRALLVHGNDLRDGEIETIARHPHLSVVYCPRTHAFFQHAPHPVQRLLDAGVRVAIGTDSRASNPDLSVWNEVQFLLRHRPDLNPESVLQMATVSGAEALLGPNSPFGAIHEAMGGIESLVSVPTGAQNLDQVWRDFAESGIVVLQN